MQNNDQGQHRFERLVARARLVLAWERLWPVAVGVAIVIGLFCTLAWLGLFVALPRSGRIAGVVLAGAALGVVALVTARAGWPSRREALSRLDRDSGMAHRLVSAREDILANPDADPATRVLWALHRRRLEAALARVRVARPSPRLVERDRFALRALVLVAVVAAAVVAGPEREGRLAAAFDWRTPEAIAAGFRLDAWIDPPPYTGRPPVLLSALDAAAAAAPIAVPVHSSIVVRASGDGRLDVETSGGLKVADAEAASGTAPATPAPGGAAPQAATAAARPSQAEHRYTLEGDGRLAMSRDGAPLAAYTLKSIPDQPPTITLAEPPTRNLHGSMTLKYRIEDDYGVVSAEAIFSEPRINGVPVTGRSLVEPPKVALSPGTGARGLGAGQTTADLAEHPWAGAEVTMRLAAHDEGGNTGTSEPTTTRLPARLFIQPLARALVEQRRNLVLSPDDHGRVVTALDALTVAPDLFEITPSVYLGVTAARKRLAAAQTDAELLGVADLLWAIALQIEDGDLSKTERDLRALQQQLKDAMARNASPEELKALTDALKQKLEQYLAELAQRQAQQAEQDPSQPRQGNERTVTPRDLQSMLDKMNEAARNGDMATAQQLLDQLQSILENLRTAKRGQSGDQAARDMDKSMSALDKLMRGQQNLRDRTYQHGAKGRRSNRNREDGQDPQMDGDQGQAEDQQPQQDQQGADDGQSQQLGQEQEALRRQLEELQRKMKQYGLEGEQGFDEAQQAMKDAERALGKGQSGNDAAVEAQGRALQGLQKGAQGLASQMARNQGSQPGEGEGQQEGNGARDGQQPDPLGRPRDGRYGAADNDVDISQGLAARAQHVLEELRRRLGDPNRPQVEQDYLERLLRRY